MNMENKRFFAGIDVGTSSMKAVLISVSGSECAVCWSASKPYNELSEPERNPSRWETVAHDLLQQLLAIQCPEAVGFTGQMHTFLAVDESGSSVAPVKLWLDMDGSDALASVNYSREQWLDMTGNIPLPDFTLAKWLWAVSQDSTLPDKIARIYCAKDAVRKALAPDSLFVTDANEAAGMQCFDPITRHWQEDILSTTRLTKRALPKVVDGREEAGKISLKSSSGENNTLVRLIVGSGDQATAARAVGGHLEGTVSVSLGTSGVLSFNTKKEQFPEQWTGDFHWFPFGFGDTEQIIGTIPSLGSTLEWFMGLYQLSRQEFGVLSSQALSTTSQVYFLPFLSGSGAPQPNHNVRSSWHNVSLNTERVDLVRAILNGIALEFSEILNRAKDIGIRVEKLVFSGGGARVEPLLAVISSTLGVPCYKTNETEASAIGAALLAADSQMPAHDIVVPTSSLEMVDTCPLSSGYREQWRSYRNQAIKAQK
ncbi:putative Xylulose kinase [Vibrio nigripulchritudo SFn27]|uniref:Putative Xylulose kinase n=2 Tax=Vibrio nigripulchritudo TaxID=28173 RepID=U4KIU3_9VIBR|nr:putative Xylulose kinase [Vibrio nigripulchritudo BLFn1]CCN90435.1 putative Xylulose kinase [Vibrio nigripulchritudo SFn27]CCN93791.1 putative Xylulose kinase [Vibrio nigripulchritudo ENn2]CCO42819.1 putative Xylulose kinase [Vibrio nigripulchritudo SFn135]CCO55607.1 putative Xylulose kinase [Vibrio nigripulchritudo Wn13]CCO61280.1 putative Xylulose kinase [Vibrio nigripulchritudo]